ncbi:MAG TPA: 30S ribosomal protein S6 [Acidimicrobiales bacterium]|jgi:small subunit ribosomal protein S6
MRPYEVMVILDPDLEDDAIQATLDKAAKTLTDAGAVINRLDPWGLRRLAYEIRHKSSGYYALFEVTAPPAAVAEVDRVLRLEKDNVLRHKVIRIPEEVAGRRLAGPPEEITSVPNTGE